MGPRGHQAVLDIERAVQYAALEPLNRVFAAAVTSFAYTDSPFLIRRDLVEAHRYAWGEIARAGSWWSGAQRTAIAAETRQARNCAFCAQRKAALSPHAVSGGHDPVSTLPPAAVEAIHQIATDPARLTKRWYEQLLDDAFTDAHYVELVGIVVTAVCIDAMHQALGLPLEPLPSPVDGEPSKQRPITATLSDQAWLPMISPQSAHGTTEEDLYPGGRTGNVITAMSLVPDAVRMLNRTQKAHYLDIAKLGFSGPSGRAISRPQIELLAARVSALNDCFY